jgi:hypothetical protein
VSKSNAWETAYLQLLFQNTNAANIGDAPGLRGSTVAGSFYIALHTADPGEAGDQTTSEIAYTSYARVAVARSAGSWAVAGAVASNVNAITFPAGTGGAGTATWASIGVASAGASMIIARGPVAPNIVCGNSITPQLPAGTGFTHTED